MGQTLSTFSGMLQFYDKVCNDTISNMPIIDFSRLGLTDELLNDLLDFDENDLRIIDKYIENKNPSIIVILSDNNLTGNIPHFPCGSISINTLDLSNNQLESIPYYIGNVMIPNIDLSNNNLKTIPETFFKNYYDQTIDLTGNPIDHLYDMFCRSPECNICKQKSRGTMIIILENTDFIQQYKIHKYIEIHQHDENKKEYNAGIWLDQNKYYSPLVKSYSK